MIQMKKTKGKKEKQNKSFIIITENFPECHR